MRDARAADWLRRLGSARAEWHIEIERLQIDGVPGLGSIEIPFSSPFTVLAGPNGVGKTTLLQAVWAALSPETASVALTGHGKLTAGSASVIVRRLADRLVGSVDFSVDKFRAKQQADVPTHHLNSSLQAVRHQQLFREYRNVEEIINGAGPKEFDAEMLAEINYITNRNYRSVVLYEVDVGEVAPFFEVAYGDDRYDSRTMGSGELSLFYLWWAIKSIDEHSVVLVEEPEAFLSQGCQASLSNYLLENAVKKRLCVLVSSHSPSFVLRVPKTSLVFLSRDATGISVITDRPHPVLFKSIGIVTSVEAYVFVEDELAKLFTKAILERFDPNLSRSIFIDQRVGDGGVRLALKQMSAASGPVRFIGLFDGDMRDRRDFDETFRKAFLPGTRPVEVLFREMISAHPKALVEILSNPDIPTIVAQLEGKDHHDWFKEFGKELGMTQDQLFGHLFNIWVRQPDNEAAAVETLNQLVRVMN